MGDVTGSYITSSSDFAEDGDQDEKTPVKEVPVEDLNGAAVTITLPTATKAPASSFGVPVVVSSLTGLNVTSFDFDLLYNPAVITPQMTQTSSVGTLSSSCGTFSNIVTVG